MSKYERNETYRNLLQENVDPYEVVTEEELNEMTLEEKISIQKEIWGDENE